MTAGDVDVARAPVRSTAVSCFVQCAGAAAAVQFGDGFGRCRCECRRLADEFHRFAAGLLDLASRRYRRAALFAVVPEALQRRRDPMLGNSSPAEATHTASPGFIATGGIAPDRRRLVMQGCSPSRPSKCCVRVRRPMRGRERATLHLGCHRAMLYTGEKGEAPMDALKKP